MRTRPRAPWLGGRRDDRSWRVRCRMTKSLRLIVLGAMGRIPFAGMAWEALHYVEGFRRLGHDVYYIEDTGAWPFDPEANQITNDSRYAVDFIARMMDWCGVPDKWAYRAVEQDGRIFGLSDPEFRRLFKSADVLVNLTASTKLHEEHLSVPARIYLQTDPGASEIQIAKGDPATIEFVRAHTHLFSFAENLGASDCRLPSGPFTYCATRQPIVLDWFTPSNLAAGNGSPRPNAHLRFTTVGNWKQTGFDEEWDGEVYAWSKHLEFLKFIELPRKIGQAVELALSGIDQEGKRMLASYGWRVIDALPFTKDILPYRDYIFSSDGEFTVAKDQNIRLRTGWFSERSASYMTAGKPVITQDTGFGSVLPTGEGLFAFSTMDEILTAFDAVRADYGRHSRAAREIANEYFRAETVLKRLLANMGL